jgi:hypothetical protein
MTGEPETEDDVLDLADFDEAEEDIADAGDDDAGDDEEDDGGEDGDEQPSDNSAIRALRAQNRELLRKVKALEPKARAAEAVDPGPRPKLEAFDWDEDKHAEAVETWALKKSAFTAAQQQPEDSTIAQEWPEAVEKFQAARQRITATQPEAEDIMLDVDRALEPGQMAAIIQAFGEKAPAILVKIGSDPDTMDRFADIRNPLKLVAEAAKLETGMTRTPPDIDRPVRGKAPTVKPAAKALEALQKKARETGDYTAYLAAKRRLGAKAKA